MRGLGGRGCVCECGGRLMSASFLIRTSGKENHSQAGSTMWGWDLGGGRVDKEVGM